MGGCISCVLFSGFVWWHNRERFPHPLQNNKPTCDEPSLYVVVPFNDPTYGGTPSTIDPVAFKAQLGALTGSGGGDCPGFSLSGVNAALDAMDAGGSLFLITDASVSNRDPVSAAGVIAKAKNKDIAI